MRLIELVILAATLALAPLAGEAQQAGKVYRVGWLGSENPIVGAPFLAAFRDGLRERGYVEGQNLSIEYRGTDGHGERLPGLAPELAAAEAFWRFFAGGAV
jgi:putative tryptophan/tyrosine transport system substrate-binding protein